MDSVDSFDVWESLFGGIRGFLVKLGPILSYDEQILQMVSVFAEGGALILPIRLQANCVTNFDA